MMIVAVSILVFCLGFFAGLAVQHGEAKTLKQEKNKMWQLKREAERELQRHQLKGQP